MYIRLNIRKDEGSRLVSLGFERFSRVGGITVTLVTMGRCLINLTYILILCIPVSVIFVSLVSVYIRNIFYQWHW